MSPAPGSQPGAAGPEPQVHEPRPLVRASTGVRGLDTVLHGGLFAGALCLVMGRPGTGKTVLANQVAHRHAGAGGQVVYVTLLSESHGRMLAHLASFEFFEPSLIGAGLYYVSAHTELEREGLPGGLRAIHRVVREHRATLLVIDGLNTAGAVARDDLDLKHFLFQLQVFCQVVGCTALLLSDAPASARPEQTVVDALLALGEERQDQRTVRTLEVVKLRGSEHLRGRHVFEITSKGVDLFPRLELLSRGVIPLAGDERRSTGVPGLDAMLSGGLLPATSTLLLGAPGSGKTLLGLTFLEAGVARGEPGLYLGFYEAPARLRQAAGAIGLTLPAPTPEGGIELLWREPLDLSVDAVARDLLDAVERRRVRRLFIDGAAGLVEGILFEGRTLAFLTALMNELRRRGVTTVMSVETTHFFAHDPQVPIRGVAALGDAVLLLRYEEARSRLRRMISIFKARGVRVDPTVRELLLSERGFEVGRGLTREAPPRRRDEAEPPPGAPGGGA